MKNFHLGCSALLDRHRKNENSYSFLGQKSDLQLIEIEREIVCAEKEEEKKKSGSSMKRSKKTSRDEVKG